MSTSSRRRTITLRDGASLGVRAITPDDKPLIAASFERLSTQSRYRRFFATINVLSSAQLDYLTDVDHHDHEALLAVDPATGDVLGVARFVRSREDPESAEVAVTVADDWQGRGLGRALLDRLTYRARQEGVRRFTALVQSDNPASLGLLTGTGETRSHWDSGVVELVIELPPKRGMGARLAEALRAAAAGSLMPARTLADLVTVAIESAPLPPAQADRPIRTIVVAADETPAGAQTLEVALELGAMLGTSMHVVGTYGPLQTSAGADQALVRARRSALAHGVHAVTHARREDRADALIAVALEQDADLLVVSDKGMSGVPRSLAGSVANKVSHRAPCSVLIVHTDENGRDPRSRG
jgi:nucleotide-binding universal stress UspA family protein/GNAT superfamily N-acetyltransferase